MKMKIKILAGVALLAGIVFVLANCQKDPQNVFSPGMDELQATNRSPSNGCEADIPEAIAVPAGHKLKYRVYATGVQIYEVKRSSADPSQFVWVNIAPSANLYAQPNYHNQVGQHYGGPTWEFTKGPYKGKKTVGVKLAGVTVDPAAIPWLLLQANENLSSPGNRVTYLQRIHTTGGLAPAGTPNEANLGQVEEVPYTATYLFFEKQH